MKISHIVSVALFALAPSLAHAGAVDWTSEEYGIYASLEIDEPPVESFLIDEFVSELASLPFTRTMKIETTNGVASATLGIKNLSDSRQDIFELSLNAFSSYSGGTDSGKQSSYVVPEVSINNKFKADSNLLTVTYDFSSLITLTEPTSGQLSYSGLFVTLRVTEDTPKATTRYLSLVDNSYVDSITDKKFSGSGSAFFDVTPGSFYTISAFISPDLFTSGSVTENSSNSVLKLGFSNRAVTAVPEPETYAMLLAGLVLVGFGARRKMQA